MRQTNYKLDLNQLRTMTGDDPDFLREILTMVLDQAPNILNQSFSLLEAGSYATLASVIHRFKSSVSILGNPDILSRVAELEIAAKSGNKKEITQLYPPFEEMVRLIISQVQAELRLSGAA